MWKDIKFNILLHHIQDILLDMRKFIWEINEWISYVHDQTIRFLNQGYSKDEIVKQIQATKPKELFKNPFLLEYYGTIEWSVRPIYMKSMGWFSGKIDDLHPCSKEMRSKGLVELIRFVGKYDKIAGPTAANKLCWYLENAYNNKKKDDDVFFATLIDNDQEVWCDNQVVTSVDEHNDTVTYSDLCSENYERYLLWSLVVPIDTF